MQFYHTAFDNMIAEIEEGNFNVAQERLKKLEHDAEMCNSRLVRLYQTVRVFLANVEALNIHLKQENKDSAISVIKSLKTTLDILKADIRNAYAEEERLRRTS